MHDGLDRIHGHPVNGFGCRERRHHEFHRFDLDIEQRGPGLPEPLGHGAFEFFSLADGLAPKAHGFRDFAEIRINKIRIGRQQSFALLLELHEPQLAVVVDGNFDRQILLYCGERIAEQHAEAAVAGQRPATAASACCSAMRSPQYKRICRSKLPSTTTASWGSWSSSRRAKDCCRPIRILLIRISAKSRKPWAFGARPSARLKNSKAPWPSGSGSPGPRCSMSRSNRWN